MSPLAKHRLIALTVFFGSLALFIGGIAVFDVWLDTYWGPDATISRSMRAFPPIAIAAFCLVTGAVVGGLACHFWWVPGVDNTYTKGPEDGSNN